MVLSVVTETQCLRRWVSATGAERSPQNHFCTTPPEERKTPIDTVGRDVRREGDRARQRQWPRKVGAVEADLGVCMRLVGAPGPKQNPDRRGCTHSEYESGSTGVGSPFPFRTSGTPSRGSSPHRPTPHPTSSGGLLSSRLRLRLLT